MTPANSKTTVLVTAAGGAGTIEIIRSLRRLDTYRVVAVDASEYAGGFIFADRGYVIPAADSGRFLEVARELIVRERPEFILPLVDEEIPIFHELIEELEGVPRLLLPKKSFCSMALDKWTTFQALSRAGLPTPRTCLPDAIDDGLFPAVVKPRKGRGSREVAYVRDKEGLENYFSSAARAPDSYVVQEQVVGPEYTVSVVVGLGGRTISIVPKEVIVKRGITQVGVTRRNGEIERVCCEVQERLKANGPFNVQLLIGPDGAPRIIEINPRFSTTVALTIAAGVNEVDIVMRDARGEDVGTPTFEEDLVMIRYYCQVCEKQGEWPPRDKVTRLDV